MTKLPVLTGEWVVKALGKIGFNVIRQRGSHCYMEHPDGRATIVPLHKGETIGKGLLRKIIRDVELERDEFMELLRKV
jgi:predicted RNA binding protein YcfA (HicA-like mRNA interferase family)